MTKVWYIEVGSKLSEELIGACRKLIICERIRENAKLKSALTKCGMDETSFAKKIEGLEFGDYNFKETIEHSEVVKGFHAALSDLAFHEQSVYYWDLVEPPKESLKAKLDKLVEEDSINYYKAMEQVIKEHNYDAIPILNSDLSAI